MVPGRSDCWCDPECRGRRPDDPFLRLDRGRLGRSHLLRGPTAHLRRPRRAIESPVMAREPEIPGSVSLAWAAVQAQGAARGPSRAAFKPESPPLEPSSTD